MSLFDRGTDAKVDRARTRASSAPSRRTSHVSRLLAGNPRRSIALLALPLALGATAVAIAKPTGTTVGDNPTDPGAPGLAQVGPVAQNGFPAWYKDKNGTRIEPCVDNQDQFCNAVFGALPRPGDPSTPNDVTDNFPDEFFYQAASAGLANIGAPDAQGKLGKASLDDSLEGAFAGGAPKKGDQMVFGRLRVKVTSGLLGDTNYLFVHPYGERTIKTDPNTDNLFVTEDIGTAAGVFTDALKGRIAPFLKWDPAVDPQAPAGYTGDPTVDHTITGGVNGNNYFALLGPGVGANKLNDGTQDCPADVLAKAANPPGGEAIKGTSGPNQDQIGQADCVYTNLFSLLGKLAQNAGVDVKSATFSRDTAGNTAVDVQAESDGGQNIVVRPTANRTSASRLFPPTKLAEDHGRYYAHLTMDSTKGFPNGSENQVQVINATDGTPQDSKNVTPVDEIVNASATWDNTLDGSGNGTLTVAGQSSDQKSNPTLSVDDPNGGQPTAFVNGQATVTTLPAAPRTVTITSGEGGTLTIPVHANMQPATPAPLTAVIRTPKASTGQAVTLFGTGSTGPIKSYAWSGPFALDANGNVDPTTPNDVNGGKITGSATDDTATLTAPSVAGKYGYQLEVTGDDGTTKAATQTILNVTDGGAVVAPGSGDPLTPGKVRYTENQGRLVVDGTATVHGSNKIKIWFANHVPANPATATADLTATVDPVDGTWVYDSGRDGMPNPPNANCVSYISLFGTPGVVGNNATLAPADEWDCLPIDGRKLANPLPPAPPPPNGAAAAASAPRAIAGAVPGAGVVAPKLAAAKVAAPAAVTTVALGTTGVPVNVTVPNGATLLRARVLTTTNKVLATSFKKVTGGKRTTVTIRSAKAARKLRGAKRFVVEIRVGTAKNRLGKATRKVIRIRA